MATAFSLLSRNIFTRFSMSNPLPLGILHWSVIDPRSFDTNLSCLDAAPFDIEEIKSVAFRFKGDKSLGLEGFTM